MALVTAALAVPVEVLAQGTITTVAGTIGVASSNTSDTGDGGPATAAKLSSQAYGVAVDSAGNIYIADTLNQRVRMVAATTGIITTIAGTGVAGFSGDGGPATSAQLNNPLSVAVDSSGNVYISDENNDRIRRVTPGGTITTFAGSAPVGANFDGDAPKAATSAHLSHPFGVAVDKNDTVYLADTGNHRVRKIVSGTISTVAGMGGPSGGTGGGNGGFNGDGPIAATSALLSYPSFVAIDASLNVYIADDCNQRIRMVTPGSPGTLTTIAGSSSVGCKTSPVVDFTGDGGPATSAHLSHPYGVGVDASGNVFIADYYNFVIRKVSGGIISTFAGIGGQSGMSDDNLPASSARLADPVGVAVDAAGAVYIVDQASFRIRKVTPPGQTSPPPTPTGLTVKRNGPNSAQISWNAVSGATSYLLKLSLTSGAAKNVVTNTTSTLVGVPGLTVGQTYYFVVSAANSGGQSADSPEVLFIIPRSVTPDFDGDHRADVVIWRPTDGSYYWLTSSTGYNTAAGGSKAWGSESQEDTPFVGDIDGDGLSDLIVWRATNGTWYWLTSSSGYDYARQGSKQWGAQSQGDIPMLGDLDGDGKVDLVVWRASSGTFFWLTSSTGYDYAHQGLAQWGDQSLGDVPFLADFDGDGKADLTVWRGSTGVWYWLTSTSNYTAAEQVQWGNQSEGDVPLVGDMDGDGKSEVIVWRAPTGMWFWLTSSSGYTTQVNAQWGNQSLGDVPLVADFDGDGRGDLGVWRASTGTWFWLTSSSGFAGGVSVQWGSESQRDRPIVK